MIYRVVALLLVFFILVATMVGLSSSEIKKISERAEVHTSVCIFNDFSVKRDNFTKVTTVSFYGASLRAEDLCFNQTIKYHVSVPFANHFNESDLGYYVTSNFYTVGVFNCSVDNSCKMFQPVLDYANNNSSEKMIIAALVISCILLLIVISVAFFYFGKYRRMWNSVKPRILNESSNLL